MRRICERFGAYKDLYTGVGDGPNDKTLEDKFFEEEVIHYTNTILTRYLNSYLLCL